MLPLSGLMTKISYVSLAKLALHTLTCSSSLPGYSLIKQIYDLILDFAFEALAEADDINWSSTQQLAGQASRGYLPYPLLGVENTVITLLFSWRK